MTATHVGRFPNLRKSLALCPPWKPSVDKQGEFLHAADAAAAVLSPWTCSFDSHLFIFIFQV